MRITFMIHFKHSNLLLCEKELVVKVNKGVLCADHVKLGPSGRDSLNSSLDVVLVGTILNEVAETTQLTKHRHVTIDVIENQRVACQRRNMDIV